MTDKKAKVAVVQAASVLFDKEACIEKAGRLADEAAAQGARLVLFPESFIPCYPRGMNFGAKIGRRLPEGRKDYRRLYENSVACPGPDSDKLAAIAARNKIYLVVGALEQDGLSIHCSVLFYGPDGSFLGRHRKLKPTASERLIWSQGDGSTLPAVDTPFGRMGAVICWENYMPLLRAAMYAKGVNLYLAPTADSRPGWQSTVQHIALEGRCFVLSCNQYVTKDMAPSDLATYSDLLDEPDLMCRGGSAIISPLGEYLAGPLFDREGILIAEIDLGQLIEAGFDFDPVGHYARNDVFRLVVDERPQKGVEFLTEGQPGCAAGGFRKDPERGERVE